MKNWKSRVPVLMLVLIMAVSMLPVAAMAEEDTVPNNIVEIGSVLFGDASKKLFDSTGWVHDVTLQKVDTKPVTIKVTDDNNLIELDDEIYELEGMHLLSKIDEDTVISNGTTSITIPAYPTDPEEQEAWKDKWYAVLLAYAPHQHDNAYWSYSKTNHWFNCAECGKGQLMMDWHSDFNADDICDVCGGPIVYYDVTIADTENGSVSIEQDAYRLNDIVYIDVEPDSGYVLDEIMAFKHREDGTSARLVVRAKTKGSEYYFKMPSFKCEVVVTFKEA